MKDLGSKFAFRVSLNNMFSSKPYDLDINVLYALDRWSIGIESSYVELGARSKPKKLSCILVSSSGLQNFRIYTPLLNISGYDSFG